MTPDESSVAQMVDAVAQALQVAVLVAEHLQLATAAAAQDAVALTRSLRGATEALERFRADGGGR